MVTQYVRQGGRRKEPIMRRLALPPAWVHTAGNKAGISSEKERESSFLLGPGVSRVLSAGSSPLPPWQASLLDAGWGAMDALETVF